MIPKQMTFTNWYVLVNQTHTAMLYIRNTEYLQIWSWEDNTYKKNKHASLPWVPLDLLFVGEFEEARADSGRHPGAHAVKEPLEGAKTHHRDEQDQLAEGVHGHPTPLQEKQHSWSCFRKRHEHQRAVEITQRKTLARRKAK